VTHLLVISQSVINLTYLAASILFILGIKGLTHPKSAVRGNLTGAIGMLVAVIAVLLSKDFSIAFIIAGVVIGGSIGLIAAIKVKMTAMPQMVAIFNGFGGLASVLVAGAAFYSTGSMLGGAYQQSISIAASCFIGSVTFFGSLVAFAKLSEMKIISSGQILFKGQQVLNFLIAATAIACLVGLAAAPEQWWIFILLLLSSSLLGLLLVIPIGGADMPVVISLLNSYSGLAAAATGFVLSNNVLIIAGSLVGASGVILTRIMCKAMNRSLTNVLFGVLGPDSSSPTQDDIYEGKVKATNADEVAMILETARYVVIVPGYGMAVAQAQHAVRDLTRQIESRGGKVEFAIHPVAGRMPGHMNVLLAEADIPYEKLKEMDEVNLTINQADVAIVIGANDVVNPVARTDPKSPIAGMPIIDVDKASTVVIIKRSLSPGFAGIPNPLFAAQNTLMCFGDGKKAIMDINASLKDL